MRLIVEHKTTSSDITPGADYWESLTVDGQVTTYLAASEDCDGVLYDVLGKIKLSPKLATPVESRKYKKDGTLYANQRDTDETPDEFLDRCIEEIGSNPDKYYQRGTVVRIGNEAREGAIDTWQTAAQIEFAMRTEAFPRNPMSCSKWGRRCEYWPVCSGTTTIDDALRYEHRPPSSAHTLPVLSASALSAWRTCARKYLYAYVQRQRPIETAHALAFGTAVHRALEVWWQTIDIEAALRVVNEIEDPYDRAKATAMMIGYHARWKDEPLNVLAVEHDFDGPLLHPDTGEASTSFVVAGRVDAIVEQQEERKAS